MRCRYCEWRCELGDEKYGVCKMYHEKGGEIMERFPFRWSHYGTSRIESVSFYHVYPGSRTMTIGTAGCNFDCKYCINAFIAKKDPAEAQGNMFHLEADSLVRMALKLGCHNIVFNVNEPTVSLGSLQGVAKNAQAAGIPMGCLTNGYATEEGLDILSSIFSFFNIGLKGLSRTFNIDYLGIPSAEPVIRAIRRLAPTRHVEITTPVIQGVNDHELEEMARLIAGIDPEIPWHVFRLLPEREMKDIAYPGILKINRALDAARRFLPYVYFHNFVGSDWVNTRCPGCDNVIIERYSLGCGGDKLSDFLCEGAICPSCGKKIKLHGERTPWKVREAAS